MYTIDSPDDPNKIRVIDKTTSARTKGDKVSLKSALALSSKLHLAIRLKQPSTKSADEKQENGTSCWEKSGNFDITYNSGGDLNRQQQYACLNPKSIIQKVILCGYKNGTIDLFVKVEKTAFNLFKNTLTKEPELQKYQMPIYNNGTCRFKINNIDILKKYFDLLISTEQSIKSIKDEIITAATQFLPACNPENSARSDINLEGPVSLRM